MAEPVVFNKGTKHREATHLNRGVLEAPIESSIEAFKGVTTGVAKIGYDAFSFGVDLTNNFIAPDDPYKVDVGDNFWQAYAALDSSIEYDELDQSVSGLTRGTAELTAFFASTRSMASKLSSMPKFKNVLANSPKMREAAIGLAAGVGADFVHTRKDDASLFSLIPKEHQSEFLQWFIDREDDSEFEGRFKNAIEGGTFGLVLEGGLRVAGKMFDTSKGVMHAMHGNNTKELLDTMEETLGNGDGSVKEAYLRENSVVGATVLDSDKPRTYVKKHGVNLPEEEVRTANAQLAKRIDDYTKRTNADQLAAKDVAEWLHEDEAQLQLFAKSILNDSSKSVEDRKLAKFILNDDLAKATRLNPETSGDAAIAQGAQLAAILAAKSGKKLKIPKNRATGEITFNMIKSLKEGTLGKTIGDFAAEGAYDADGVLRVMARINHMGGDIEETITAARGYRHEMAITARKQADAILNLKKKVGSKEFDELMGTLLRLDDFDHEIQGAVGTSGRILRMQQVNPSEFSLQARDWLNKNELDQVKGNLEDESFVKRRGVAMSRLMEDINTGRLDEDKMQAVVKDIRDQVDSPEGLTKALKGDTFMDLAENYILGGLLSSTKTLFGSVMGGNMINTFLKSWLVPSIEGTIGTAMRTVGITRAARNSASITDGLVATKVLVQKNLEAVSNLFKGTNKKGLDELFHLSYSSSREGTEKVSRGVKELRGQYKRLADFYASNDMYVKYNLLRLVSPIMAGTNAFTNIFGRGISGMDKYFRGINNEVHMAIEAERAWLKDGGDQIFKGITDKKTFVDRYQNLQREYAEISRNDTLSLEQKSEAFNKLFNGNAGLEKEIKASLDRAELIGRQATLQQDPEGVIATGIENMSQKFKKNPLTHAALLMSFPFRRTPMNQLNQIIDHNPVLAWTATRNRDALLRGTPDEQIRVVSQMAAGGIFMGLGGMLYQQGRLQGSIADQDRKAFEAKGIPEYSIRVDDTWYSYRKMGAVGVYMSSMADLFASSQTDDVTAAMLLSQSFAIANDESHLRTVRELIELADMGGPGGLEKPTKFVLRNSTRSIIPASSFTQTAFDIKDMFTQGSTFKYRSLVDEEVGNHGQELRRITSEALASSGVMRGVLSTTGVGDFEQDLDMLGTPIKRNADTLGNKLLSIFGLDNRGENFGPGRQALFEHGLISQKDSGHTIKGDTGSVILSKNDYKNLQNKIWHSELNLEKELDQFVQTKEFRGAVIGDQRRMLESFIKESTDLIKARAYDSSEKLQAQDFKNNLFRIWRENTKIPPNPDTEDGYVDARKRRDYFKANNKVIKELLNRNIDKTVKSDESVIKEHSKALKELGIDIGFENND